AFSHGERKIEAVAIWSKNPEIFPCGACRQVILELAPDADIIINGREDKLIVLNVSDLMPFAFDKTNLK
ncbi:MAG: cytidine deaminase, partial [Endomicrobia bacterium]|nr:cytidine deaminase [Endomicrobiia bacterium]